MDYTKMKIETSQEGLDLLCALLPDIGITGFEIEDPKEFKNFLQDDSRNWDYIDNSLLNKQNITPSISFYLPQNSQGEGWIREVEHVIDTLKQDKQVEYGSLQLMTQVVKEEEWAHTWKQYFKPFPVGAKLFIKPGWEKGEIPEGRTVLEIDPETSFGTGQHHTTKMCLELLEQYIKGGETVLDMGCGSGILATAAMLLGAASVLGVDIEENSMVISEKNMKRNYIPPEGYAFVCGDVLQEENIQKKVEGTTYDLVVANIVADVIKAQKEVYKRVLRQGGTLIVSGIIDTRKEEVKTALMDIGIQELITRETKGWVAMVFEKGIE